MIHLLNEINTMTARSLASGTPPMREEMLPISGISLRLRDRDIRKVTLQPEDTELAMRKTADYVEVSVPVLEMHSMVVAER